MVTINLKPLEQKRKRKVFVVHKNFICHYSPYFDAAFNGNFEEARSQALDLEDINPFMFEMFVSWIYTQDVCYPDGEAGYLILLWLLAERFLVPRLQNQTLELLHKEQGRSNKLPGADLVRVLYENTTEASPLRKYVIWTCAAGLRRNPQCPENEDYPPEFFFDMIAYLRPYPIKPNRLPDHHLIQYFVGNEQVRESSTSCRTIKC
jgi:hypothetical protein